MLVVESERLEAPWLLPSTGTLTALACGVCTLGVALEERVRTLFAQGKRSLALALDSLQGFRDWLRAELAAFQPPPGAPPA